jgi:hypothetical protein
MMTLLLWVYVESSLADDALAGTNRVNEKRRAAVLTPPAPLSGDIQPQRLVDCYSIHFSLAVYNILKGSDAILSGI